MRSPGYAVYDPGKKCKSPHYTAWAKVDDLGTLNIYSEHGGVPAAVAIACIESAPDRVTFH